MFRSVGFGLPEIAVQVPKAYKEFLFKFVHRDTPPNQGDINNSAEKVEVR